MLNLNFNNKWTKIKIYHFLIMKKKKKKGNNGDLPT